MSTSLIPNPKIEQPKFQWRGFLLDSARTCFQVDEVKTLLDLLNRYRFNVLHWHLTDDAGWRFSVPQYPKLETVSSQLPRMDFLHYSNVEQEKAKDCVRRAETQWHGGGYSDSEIKEIVSYAVSKGIKVMPEVDLPGHMAAAIRAYPELGNPIYRDRPQSEWGIENDLLWPSDFATNFIETLFGRVCELFPDAEYIHLGGDECKWEKWEADADLMAWCRKQNLSGGSALQGWFMNIARRVLHQHGRRAAVWNEACQTGLDPSDLVVGWEEEGGVQMAQQSGHPYISADANYLYLNRVASNEPDEPVGMTNPITLQDLWHLPIPEDDRILGLQASVWAEYVLDGQELLRQAFPRLLLVSEKAWCGDNIEWDDLVARMKSECEYLEGQGVTLSHYTFDTP
ncbi:family 20 glycosylhydrolase [Boudabousia liubingyangii]|nr:family 20 glycosylhydrolase [Boudabousia liubingyangii]